MWQDISYLLSVVNRVVFSFFSSSSLCSVLLICSLMSSKVAASSFFLFSRACFWRSNWKSCLIHTLFAEKIKELKWIFFSEIPHWLGEWSIAIRIRTNSDHRLTDQKFFQQYFHSKFVKSHNLLRKSKDEVSNITSWFSSFFFFLSLTTWALRASQVARGILGRSITSQATFSRTPITPPKLTASSVVIMLQK